MLLKSPVNRFGGKYFLRNWLAEKIPDHTLYSEPFCGASHLLFAKTPSQVEVINDIDNHLIGFFRVIQHPETRQMLIDRLNFMPYSRALWQEIRSRWKQGNLPADEIERASQWFYLNRTCFSGDQKRGGFAVPSVTGRNPVISFRNSIDGLDTIAERLRNVCIENLDYADCIQKYDSPQTLYLVDPPYLLDTDRSKHYYSHNFTLQDHYKLAEILHGVKGQAMITHYQNSQYDDLYKGWQRYEYQSFKGSHKSEGGKKPKTLECLWTNFNLPGTRGLFNAYA
ncbi:MAG TPA: DNA adenine methylase [Candidatus Wunengus sp. YC60]|uniref:DNA adenine methylase n=1 Tax=Candidatus Wunengus sp. YC60 TaxID=3367697 RepID=UPI0040291FD6